MARAAAGWCLLAVLWSAGPAIAAEGTPLQRATARVMQAAGPWCGRWAELDAQGVRHCRLPVQTAAAGTAAQGAAFMASVLLTDALVQGLDEAELALVLGHELAHIVLGHGMLRARAAASTPEARRTLVVFADLLPQPHVLAPLEPPAQETDADTLAIVFAGLAGYPLAAAPRLWQQRLPALGHSAAASASHPSAADRALAAGARFRQFCAALRRGANVLPPEPRLQPEADYRKDEVQALQARIDASAVCAGVKEDLPP